MFIISQIINKHNPTFFLKYTADGLCIAISSKTRKGTAVVVLIMSYKNDTNHLKYA